MSDESIILTGPEQVNGYRLLAIRAALRVEILTTMRHSRVPAVTLVNAEMGTAFRNTDKGKRAAYAAFDAYLTEKLPGMPPRPLPERKS